MKGRWRFGLNRHRITDQDAEVRQLRKGFVGSNNAKPAGPPGGNVGTWGDDGGNTQGTHP